MTAADIVDIGLSIFGNADVQPVIVGVVGVALFGSITKGLRRFFG